MGFSGRLPTSPKIIKIKGKKDRYAIVKCEPKIRPIKYSSHLDGHIYAYYANLLTPNYEKLLEASNLSDIGFYRHDSISLIVQTLEMLF